MSEKQIELINGLLKFCNEKGITKNIRTTIVIKELSAWYEVDEHSILKTLLSIHSNDKLSASDFPRLIEEKLKVGENLKNWTLYIPINYDIRKRKIVIDEHEIEVIAGSSIAREFKNRTFHRYTVYEKTESWKRHDRAFTHEEWYILKLEANGKTLPSAFYAYLDLLECLQGIVNLIKLNGNIRYSFPFSKGRSEFFMAHTMYSISQEGELEYIEFESPTISYPSSFKLKRFDKFQKKSLDYLLSRMKGPIAEKSIKETLFHCYRLYNTGISSVFKFNAFLVFWQLCEAVSLSAEFRGDTKKVIKRIAFHLDSVGLISDTMEKTLKKLAELRNDMVHRGFDRTDQDDVVIMKFVAERALNWLIGIEQDLEDIHQLDLYYSLRTASNKVLKDRETVLKLLSRKRKR